MLAEIYLLKLEAAVRAAKEAPTTASTSRFVPVTLPAAKANPAFHRTVAICPPQLGAPSDSEQFRHAPRTCRGVGGKLRMRYYVEGGTSHVRHGTAGVRGAARRHGGMAACGAHNSRLDERARCRAW